MSEKATKLLKVLTTTVIGLGLAFAIMCWRGVFEVEGINKILEAVSDGFFVAGMIYMGFGLLLLIVNEGILDIMGFGFKSLVYLFTPRRLDRSATDYYEYRMKKKEERAERKVDSTQLWVGVAFILVSIIAVIAAYSI